MLTRAERLYVLNRKVLRMNLINRIKQVLQPKPRPIINEAVSRLSPEAMQGLRDFANCPRGVADAALQLLSLEVKSELHKHDFVTIRQHGKHTLYSFTPRGYKAAQYLGS